MFDLQSKTLEKFLNARRVAVIGASRSKEKVGHVIFRNLLRNVLLDVFPVNPNADFILGKKAYKDVLEIPFNVDLSIISVKAELVPQVLDQCGQKGIKNVMIISSGFKEVGNFVLEKKIEEIAKKYSIKVMGPNIMGFIDTYQNINASFFKEIPKKGRVAFLSQSGAAGSAFIDMSMEKQVGFSFFVSLGNMMDLDFIQCLEYLEKDRKTKIIALYMESLKEATGRRFVELCKRIAKNKKIIVLKSGKTEEGTEVAKTHTAALSTMPEIYSAAFSQAGITEVRSFKEMLNVVEILIKFGDLGKKTCIISNAGGMNVLAADACVEAGILLPEIPHWVLSKLNDSMPIGYSKKNPLDILGDARVDRYAQVLNILNREKFFDFFIVILTPQEMTQALETAQILAKVSKPVFAFFLGGKAVESAKVFLRQSGIFVFDDVSDIRILGKAVEI